MIEQHSTRVRDFCNSAKNQMLKPCSEPTAKGSADQHVTHKFGN